MANRLQSALACGRAVLKVYGAVSLTLSGTASAFDATIDTIADVPNGRDDWTPSDDEEAYVYIDKADIAAAGVTLSKGKTLISETGIYYEIIEAKTKGIELTARFRCRLYNPAS